MKLPAVSRSIWLPIAIGALLAAGAAETVNGQGRGRRFRRQPPAPPTPSEPAEEKKKAATEIEHYVAITGGDVYLGTGQLIRRGTVLIGDAKILEVGTDVTIPDGAERIDATDKTVAPGFVVPILAGIGLGRLNEKARDSVNPFDPSIKRALAAGITSYVALGNRGTDAPGGQSAIIKLAYGDLEGMVAAENSVYTMRVPLGVDKLTKLRELIESAKKHRTELAAYRSKPGTEKEKGKPPAAPKNATAVLAVLEGKAKLWIGTSGGGGGFFGRRSGATFDNAAIRQALRIAGWLERGVVLDQPVTAWSIPDEIAAADCLAILNPRDRQEPDPKRPRDTGSNLASAALLSAAGVPVAVTCPPGRFGGGVGTGGILGQDLNTPHIDAAFAIRGGLAGNKALRTLTADAAEIAGVGAKLGSIAAGKDADLLILDGDPLHYATFVETALVNGKVVYEKDKESFYSHIKR